MGGNRWKVPGNWHRLNRPELPGVPGPDAPVPRADSVTDRWPFQTAFKLTSIKPVTFENFPRWKTFRFPVMKNILLLQEPVMSFRKRTPENLVKTFCCSRSNEFQSVLVLLRIFKCAPPKTIHSSRPPSSTGLHSPSSGRGGQTSLARRRAAARARSEVWPWNEWLGSWARPNAQANRKASKKGTCTTARRRPPIAPLLSAGDCGAIVDIAVSTSPNASEGPTATITPPSTL